MNKGMIAVLCTLVVVPNLNAAAASTSTAKTAPARVAPRAFYDGAVLGLDRAELQALLDRGADKDYEDYGSSALHAAVFRGHVATVATLLDDFGLDKDATNIGNITPLMLAVVRNHPAVVQLLLDRRANMNVQGGSDLKTALMVAAEKNYPEIVRMLLEAGADPYIKNDAGQSFVDYIYQTGHLGLIKIWESFLARGKKAAAVPAPQLLQEEMSAPSQGLSR